MGNRHLLGKAGTAQPDLPAQLDDNQTPSPIRRVLSSHARGRDGRPDRRDRKPYVRYTDRVNRRRARLGLFLLSACTSCLGEADTLLLDAVKAQNIAAVRERIAAHADVNGVEPDGFTALHWAAERNNLGLVQLLVAAGADEIG